MNENFISPNNLSKFADVIFAENLSVDDFKILNNKDLVVVHETKNLGNESITYKVKSFDLKEYRTSFSKVSNKFSVKFSAF